MGKIGVGKVMIRLTRNDYKPDICFWKNEKTQKFTEKQSAFPPPNFIIEILSESTKERDRVINMEDYTLRGVREYWLVDTESQTLEQYFLNEKKFDLALKVNSGILKSNDFGSFREEIVGDFNNNLDAAVLNLNETNSFVSSLITIDYQI